MSQDISGYGVQLRLIADLTFPAGITITQFADDADPFDVPETVLGDKGMGLNGDQVAWSKATPLEFTTTVIPNSDDDQNLAILFANNRPGAGKLAVQDTITVTIIYPNGAQTTFQSGKCISSMPAIPIASSGRMKSRPYKFSFENVS